MDAVLGLVTAEKVAALDWLAFDVMGFSCLTLRIYPHVEHGQSALVQRIGTLGPFHYLC